MKKILQSKTPSVDQQDIEKILSEFRVIEGRSLPRVIFISLFALAVSTAVFTALGLYTNGDFDILYISAGISIIVYIFVSLELFQSFPKTLLVLWKRNIIRIPEQAAVQSNLSDNNNQLSEFLERTRLALRDRMGILFGFLGLGISVWAIWLLDQNWLSNLNDNLHSIPIELTIVFLLRLSFCFSGFICGMIAWRILAISKQISELGKNFHLDIQIDHPDECGGLRPIGDLSLKIVYCLVPFMILIGSWLIFVNTLDFRFLRLLPANISHLIFMLQILIFPLIAFGFLVFFLPLVSLHKSMLHAKSKFQIKLDAIGKEMHSIGQELLNDAVNLTPEDGIVLEKKLEFLKRTYSRFDSIPTWPFRVDHLLRLGSTQIIPIIGLISTLVKFFQDFAK